MGGRGDATATGDETSRKGAWAAAYLPGMEATGTTDGTLNRRIASELRRVVRTAARRLDGGHDPHIVARKVLSDLRSVIIALLPGGVDAITLDIWQALGVGASLDGLAYAAELDDPRERRHQATAALWIAFAIGATNGQARTGATPEAAWAVWNAVGTREQQAEWEAKAAELPAWVVNP